MTIWQHFKAAIGVVVISINLILALIPLLILLVLSIFRRWWPSIGPLLHQATAFLYRCAVAVNDWWLCKVIGINWQPDPSEKGQTLPTQLDKNGSYLVIANHQSWFDIYILQSLVTRQGPMLSFLVKQELVYVPIIGWIILALRFPLLSRQMSKQHGQQIQSSASSDAEDKHRRDIQAIATACDTVKKHPTALMNFVEGTRFTPAKQQATNSPYMHLLRPRSKGLSAMLNALENDVEGIIDITLRYPSAPTFWQCMSGKHQRINCRMELIPCPVESNVNDWLEQRWRLKNETLDSSP
ncbi:MAG: acetyltransferase [Pseudomonadales bacterium]